MFVVIIDVCGVLINNHSSLNLSIVMINGFVFKVELLLELERATPRKVLRKIWVPYCVEYPNRKRTWRQKVGGKIGWVSSGSGITRIMEHQRQKCSSPSKLLLF